MTTCRLSEFRLKETTVGVGRALSVDRFGSGEILARLITDARLNSSRKFCVWKLYRVGITK